MRRFERVRRAATGLLMMGAVSGMAAMAANLTPALVLVVVGPPGSGKTVQSKALSKKYKIPSISLADLGAAEVGKKTRLGQMLEATIQSGDLLDDNAANELMKQRILRADAGRGFILDGYPRTEAQAEFLDRMLKDNDLPPPKVVLLEAPDGVVTKRMLARKQADDSPAMIESRLREYHDDAKFLEGWYQTENVIRVDATVPATQVSQQVLAKIEDALATRSFKKRGEGNQ